MVLQLGEAMGVFVMRGRHYLDVSTKRVKYSLCFDRGVSIIQGDSGVGKSTLVNLVQDYISGESYGVKLKTSASNVVVFDSKTDWYTELKRLSNTIILIDEGVKYVVSKGFSDALDGTDNYIVIIGREGRYGDLTFAINSIYTLSGESFQQQLIVHNDKVISLKPDVIITEDSKSGFDIISRLFNCKVVSAHGKNNVVNTLEGEHGVIYLVVDGAAFGSIIERIINISRYKDVYVFAPESFEYLILATSVFRRHCKQELKYTENYADTTSYYTWERYYTELLRSLCKEMHLHYNKEKWDKLHRVFRSQKFLCEIGAQFPDIDSVLRNEYK